MKSTALAVGLKPSANQGKARLRGLYRIIYSKSISDLEKKIRQIVERARVDYADFLSSGRITDELVESALLLAQVDTIFRAKVVDKNLGDVHKEDIEDLSKLISLIDLQFFKASRLCLLNPTFGDASLLVGGADADLVIDDAIIDIKTTKNFGLERDQKLTPRIKPIQEHCNRTEIKKGFA